MASPICAPTCCTTRLSFPASRTKKSWCGVLTRQNSLNAGRLRCASLHTSCQQSQPKEGSQTSTTPPQQRLVNPVTAGLASIVTLLGGAATALAEDLASDQIISIADPGDPGSPTFTSFLIFMCMGYWLVKAVSYFLVDRGEDDQPASQDDKEKSKRGKGMDMTAHSKAPIRSFTEGGPNAGQDPQEFRNQSLARSATYHVITAVRESQPRIHSMLLAEAAAKRRKASGTAPAGPHHDQQQPAQPAGAQHAGANGDGHGPGSARFELPVRPTAHDLAANDPVAQLVAERVDKLTSAQGPEALVDLESRNLVVLEQQLLEDLAQQVACDEIKRLKEMASSGQLRVDGRPCGSAGADAAAAATAATAAPGSKDKDKDKLKK